MKDRALKIILTTAGCIAGLLTLLALLGACLPTIKTDTTIHQPVPPASASAEVAYLNTVRDQLHPVTTDDYLLLAAGFESCHSGTYAPNGWTVQDAHTLATIATQTLCPR